MQITCENCLKNFEVKDSLIPTNGRMLQCGSCEHKWFYSKNKFIGEKKILKYNSDKEELLTINAIIALINKIKPLAASNLKNHLNGAEI